MILEGRKVRLSNQGLGAYDSVSPDVFEQLATSFVTGYDQQVVNQNMLLPIGIFLGILLLANSK